ncbi:MAG: DUF4382 domain-containing protein, partial [Bdellovibrionales bacterium]|nr:DUF4382 domain-containing protein [Bdellovibrionales bacterium]
SNNGGEDHDEDDNDGDNNGSDKEEEAKRECYKKCKDIQIDDVILRVVQIQLKNKNGDIVTTVSDVKNLSLYNMKQGIKFIANREMETKQVRLILANEGNYILATNGKRYALKTPSQQQSGLVLVLTRSVKVKKGKEYILRAEFSPERQLNLNSKQCMLKPEWHNVTLGY